MSGEIIAILGVGVALAGLRGEIGKLRERMAHLEGLREAITGRATAS